MLFRRLLAGRRQTEPPPQETDSTCYRAASYLPLRPWQVRRRPFTRRGRRGVDAAEVRNFLDQVAGDLADAYKALSASRAETARVEAEFRQWRARQSRYAHNGHTR
ncbi:DivIVA domain-containing protein [Micromonospora zhanjiangensis]|uniref:DivIVA domain-containing protein n=1 Tax=Micromonospora zhanjiangensis TaxID=1522057 RepID=A0ABV8KN24_9ACTN